MHQVREVSAGAVAGADDLPDALGGGLPAEHEWRVHFHVPVHAAEHTTQRELERTLAALAGGQAPRHRATSKSRPTRGACCPTGRAATTGS